MSAANLHPFPTGGETLEGCRSSSRPDHETNETNEVTERRTDAAAAEFLIPRKPVSSNERATESIRTSGTHNRPLHIIKHWWLEIGASLLFVAVLLAIAATLYPHQNKPLPQWPYSISINALLSIYVVVLKAAIALVTAEGLGQLKWTWFRRNRPLEGFVKYDEASRGPLGSFKLLWWLGLHQPLSSVGAIITVILIGIDPFAQQLLRYHDCSVVFNGAQATVPRTNFYIGAGAHLGALSESITPPLQAAINAGIFSPGVAVTHSCLTGNCSLPQEYSTMGYCSSCEEVTDRLKFENGFEGTGDAQIPSVTTSLPSNLSVIACWEGDGQNFATMSTVAIPDGISFQSVEIIVAKRYDNFDPSTGNLPVGCQNASTNNTWHCTGYGAASCTLYPCVRTYSSRVDFGVLYETELSRSDADTLGIGEQPSLATVDTKCLSDHERQSLSNAGYKLNSSSRFLAYNLSYAVDPTVKYSGAVPFPQSLFAHGCVYIFDLQIVESLWTYYMNDLFNGTLYGLIGTSGAVVEFSGPQTLQTIYNYGAVDYAHIDSTFRNVSDSMTAFVRQNGQANYSVPAGGIVLHDQTCLQVRWGWIAFPAAVVVLTLVFLVVTIVDTRPNSDGIQIWKSSPLAIMFHGLEQPSKHQSTPEEFSEIREMERLAAKIRVRLGASEAGVKLVEVDDKEA